MSGKSALAAALADTGQQIVHLEMDRILDEFIHGSSHDFADRLLGYAEMHQRARSYLLQGQLVVVDCTYSRKQYREGLAASLPHNCHSVLAECQVTEDEALRRFENRKRHHAVDLTKEGVRRSVSEFRYSNLGIVLEESSSPAYRLSRLNELMAQGPYLDLPQWVEFGL